MLNLSLVFFGKLLSQLVKICSLGNGSTWPGHIALIFNKNFVQDLLRNTNLKIILVAGTNGKTTTSLLIKTILESSGKRVIHNSSGANMLNGIASTLLLQADLAGKIEADYAIFEVDENALIYVLKEIDPQYIILLNLFRDQLDRYGEVAAIARKWAEALKQEETIQLILNADDPEIAFIGQQLFNHKRVKYFGLNQKGRKEFEHAVDSIYCPRCGTKLEYKNIYYSHLGDWSCPHCNLKRPQLVLDAIQYVPLVGLYNTYNALAAALLTQELGIEQKVIKNGLQAFKPAFGRQEEIVYQGKKIQIFLSKNPAGFNQCLQTIKSLRAKKILISLNDRVADGRDVSWIWDVDTEILSDFAGDIIITGDRAYDMGLRMKYNTKIQNSNLKSQKENLKFEVIENTSRAVHETVNNLSFDETLYILPTYTAMLDIRKIISGKKIL